MMKVLNILYVGALFSVFICLLSLPIGLLVWGVRRYCATHRLGKLPWRRRRALFGLALLWTAAFSRLARWKKIAGIAVILSLLLVVFLSWLNAALYCDTPEAIITSRLTDARYYWLEEGCPRPINAQRYLRGTGYVYTESLVVNDGRLEDRKWSGLFAIKDAFSPKTYAIATTGEIFVLDGAGVVRLWRPR